MLFLGKQYGAGIKERSLFNSVGTRMVGLDHGDHSVSKSSQQQMLNSGLFLQVQHDGLILPETDVSEISEGRIYHFV